MVMMYGSMARKYRPAFDVQGKLQKMVGRLRGYKRKYGRRNTSFTKGRKVNSIQTFHNRGGWASGMFPRNAMANPVPNTRKFSLTYSEQVPCTTITGGLSGTGVNISLNDIFDPNKTGGGHQPYGHDQWTAFYTRYKVTWVELKLEWVTGGSEIPAGQTGCWKLLNPSEYPGGTNITSGLQSFEFKERPRSGLVRLEESMAPITQKIYLPSIVGATNAADGRFGDNFSGPLGSGGPLNQICINLNATNDNGTGSVTSYCYITVVYHGYFYDPRTLLTSYGGYNGYACR